MKKVSNFLIIFALIAFVCSKDEPKDEPKEPLPEFNYEFEISLTDQKLADDKFKVIDGIISFVISYNDDKKKPTNHGLLKR